jgi:hypothetical protein
MPWAVFVSSLRMLSCSPAMNSCIWKYWVTDRSLAIQSDFKDLADINSLKVTMFLEKKVKIHHPDFWVRSCKLAQMVLAECLGSKDGKKLAFPMFQSSLLV